MENTEILNYILKEFSMAENGTQQANYGHKRRNDKHYISSFVGFSG
jgi:hypothetical protein